MGQPPFPAFFDVCYRKLLEAGVPRTEAAAEALKMVVEAVVRKGKVNSRHLLDEPKGKVKIAKVSATSVTCQCTHLTEFVVMNKPDGYKAPGYRHGGITVAYR